MRLGDTNGYPTCSGQSPPPFFASPLTVWCPSPLLHTSRNPRCFFSSSFLKLLVYRCSPWLARICQTYHADRSLSINQKPVGSDSTQDAGYQGPSQEPVQNLIAEATHHPPAELAPMLDTCFFAGRREQSVVGEKVFVSVYPEMACHSSGSWVPFSDEY